MKMKVTFNTNQQAGYVVRLSSEELGQIRELFPSVGTIDNIPDALSRLFTAAPDMLEACKLLLMADGMEDDGYNDSLFLSQVHCAIDKAQAAIQKAEKE
jgi:hypothetical protein